jgi:hypothetical protein
LADVDSIVVFRDAPGVSNGSPPEDRDNSLDRSSAEYWRARERAERAAAKNASSPLARGVHQELAQEYAERVRRLESDSVQPSAGQR